MAQRNDGKEILTLEDLFENGVGDDVRKISSAERALQSEGKRFNTEFLRNLRAGILKGALKKGVKATVITIDGNKGSGKSTLRQRLHRVLSDSYGLEVWYFRESDWAEHDVKEKWRTFRRRYRGFNGDPLEAAKLATSVRMSAFAVPSVLERFLDSRIVILYERSYAFTVAAAMAGSLSPLNRFAKEGRRDPVGFMAGVLRVMDKTYFVPDLALILHIGHRNMREMLTYRQELEGRDITMGIPPRNVGSALYNLGKKITVKGDTVLPNAVRIDADRSPYWNNSSLERVYQRINEVADSEVRKVLKRKGFLTGDR